VGVAQTLFSTGNQCWRTAGIQQLSQLWKQIGVSAGTALAVNAAPALPLYCWPTT